MPVLMIKIVPIIALLTTILIIRKWVIRRNRKKRNAALKRWIDKQDRQPNVVYRRVQTRLAQQEDPN